jgi:hypothetical protein
VLFVPLLAQLALIAYTLNRVHSLLDLGCVGLMRVVRDPPSDVVGQVVCRLAAARSQQLSTGDCRTCGIQLQVARLRESVIEG